LEEVNLRTCIQVQDKGEQMAKEELNHLIERSSDVGLKKNPDHVK